MSLRKEIINELSKPVPANLHTDNNKLNTKKAMKKYEEQLDNHIIDCCFKVLGKRIDSMIEPYNNADDMLGQSILEKLLEVKEMIKAEMAPEHLK